MQINGMEDHDHFRGIYNVVRLGRDVAEVGSMDYGYEDEIVSPRHREILVSTDES
jgi:hypothetical protein